MDRAAVSEAANGSSNLPGSTTFEVAVVQQLRNVIVVYEVTANYPNLVTKRQFQTHFGHTLVM